MLVANRQKYTESICIGADGFCFTLPDGRRSIAVRSPYTAIPYCRNCDNDPQIAGSIFHAIFASDRGLVVRIEHIEPLQTDIVFGVTGELENIVSEKYPEAEVHSHIYSFLAEEYGKGTLSAVWQDEEYGFDIFAIRNGQLLLLNAIRMNDPYKIAYYILKVWKEVGFRTGENEIRLYGFGEGPVSTVIRNLKLMTGDNTVCVL